MREEHKAWLLGGGAAVLVILLLRSSRNPDTDTDALTQMLIAETDFASITAEMAQIVFVALNRARKWGVSPATVVTPPGRPGVWNTGEVYSRRFYAAKSSPRWEQARAFVKLVQSGAYANDGAMAFVHPAGMPMPPCGSNRVAANTIAGERCLPTWALGGQVVGKAMFA